MSTLTSPNLTKIWRGHVLSFVDLIWNDPLIFYAFDDHFLLCACIMASQPADLHRLQYEKASVVRGHHINL